MHTFIFVYVHTCKHISWNSDFLLCCLSDCLIFKFCVSECHGNSEDLLIERGICFQCYLQN